MCAGFTHQQHNHELIITLHVPRVIMILMELCVVHNNIGLWWMSWDTNHNLYDVIPGLVSCALSAIPIFPLSLLIEIAIINPCRTCAARVTVLGPCVSLSVCLSVCLHSFLNYRQWDSSWAIITTKAQQGLKKMWRILLNVLLSLVIA